jgi:hypothetical protein
MSANESGSVLIRWMHPSALLGVFEALSTAGCGYYIAEVWCMLKRRTLSCSLATNTFNRDKKPFFEHHSIHYLLFFFHIP